MIQIIRACIFDMLQTGLEEEEKNPNNNNKKTHCLSVMKIHLPEGY